MGKDQYCYDKECEKFNLDFQGYCTQYNQDGPLMCGAPRVEGLPASSGSTETVGYERADRSELTYEDWQNMIKQAAENKDVEALRLMLIDLLELRNEM